MAGLIPKNFIDDLLARVDIVDVIDAYVKLTKGGRDYKACCPFHNEKSPSFTVSQEKQFYHCFGCGAHGTAVSFLMEYAGLDFPDAVEQLAERIGVEVPREGGAQPREDHTRARELMAAANDWYQQQLRAHPGRETAVAYLRRRGLSGKVAASYELGFAPPGRTNLLGALGRDEATRGHLLEAGLVSERAPGQYQDRFRNRVMFPIHDRRGQVVGFGARVLDDGQPKYLNSPETPLFHKGRELYGLYQARRAQRKLERVVVVEGYMDVVALAQFGISNAVATLGTAATPEHVEKLFQNTTRVVFCFDGDRAGRQAAWRALENALPLMRDGREIGFAFLPDGEDPDTLIRAQGPGAFEAVLAAAQPLSDALFKHLSEDTDLTTMEGRSKLFQDATPLLARLPPGAFRELAHARLAELTHLSEQQLETLRATAAPPRRAGAGGQLDVGQRTGSPAGDTRPRAAGRAGGETGSRTPSVTRTAITLLLHQPELAASVPDATPYADLGVAGSHLLHDMLEVLHAKPDLTTGGLIEHFRDHVEGRHLARLLGGGEPLIAEGLEAELGGALEKLLHLNQAERFKTLTAKAREQGLDAAEKREFVALTATLSGDQRR